MQQHSAALPYRFLDSKHMHAVIIGSPNSKSCFGNSLATTGTLVEIERQYKAIGTVTFLKNELVVLIDKNVYIMV